MTYEMALLEREAEGEEKTTIKNLQSVMENLKMTAEKAMEVLNISKSKRDYYLEMLKKQEENFL